ncbi:MAG: thiamine phosphate synthase [Planctomycetota bacterium]
MNYPKNMDESFSVNTLRLIDANANRAREGIRTAEDYIRFACGNNRWSTALKTIRGAINNLLKPHFSDEALIKSRHVIQDPLRPNKTADDVAQNGDHESAKKVAHRGLKRAQEAARVMEEYLRASYPATAREFANFRYKLYEAEQWLISAGDNASIVNDSAVYVLLTEALCQHGLLATAKAVLKSGVRLLQLREKGRADQDFLRQARDLQSLCLDFGAILICNDRCDVAIAADVAGVHLGQEDLAPAEARFLTGEKLLIGRSTHSIQQVKFAIESEQADYIAIGAMYETTTKSSLILAGVALAEQVSAQQLPIPVFAIGGITVESVAELKTAGVRHIAVSSAIIADHDPYIASCRFVEAMLK